MIISTKYICGSCPTCTKNLERYLTLITGNDFNIKLGTGSHVFPINNYLGRDKSRLFVNFKMVIFNGKFVGDFRISA